MKAGIKAVRFLIWNGLILWMAYEYLIMDNPFAENLFIFFSWFMLAVYLLFAIGKKSVKEESLKEMRDKHNKPYRTPLWLALLPDWVITGFLIAYGHYVLAVVWILWMMLQQDLNNFLKTKEAEEGK